MHHKTYMISVAMRDTKNVKKTNKSETEIFVSLEKVNKK